MSCVLRDALVDIFVEQHPRDHVQRLEHAFAFVCTAGKRRHLHVAVVEQEIHVFRRRGVGQITFVVLQNVGNLADVELQRFQIVREILKRLDVLRHFFILRIGNKNYSVHAAQHQLPRSVVNHLAGNRVKLEFRLEAFDGHRFDRQEVEEQRAVGTRRERHELALVARVGLDVVVDLHEVRRLATHCRAVIDDFYLQLFGSLIDDGHK
jgi:hypothetical protein